MKCILFVPTKNKIIFFLCIISFYQFGSKYSITLIHIYHLSIRYINIHFELPKPTNLDFLLLRELITLAKQIRNERYHIE